MEAPPADLYTLSLHDALPIWTKPITGPKAWRGAEITNDPAWIVRSEEHTSELQSLTNLVCRLLLEKKKEPEILVLDEPSSNLDPASRRELADILRSLDVTVLMVTHDLPYALELCPRSVVLSDGHVVADGSAYDVQLGRAARRGGMRTSAGEGG